MGNTQDAELYRPSADKTWKAYCAIDVGAISCGYAYSFDGVKHTWLNKNWAERLGYFSQRTPSAILYDRSGIPEAFGFEACEKYMSMSKEEIKQARFVYEGLLKVSSQDIGLESIKQIEDSGTESDKSDDDHDDDNGQKAGVASASGKKENKKKRGLILPEVLKSRCDIAVLLAKHCKGEIEAKYSFYKKTPDEIVWAVLVPLTWDIKQKKKFRKLLEQEFFNHFSNEVFQRFKFQLITSTEALWLASKEQVIDKLASSKLPFKKENKKGEKAVVLIHSGGTMTEISIHTKKTGANPVAIMPISIGGRYVNNLFEEHFVNSLEYDGAKFIKQCKEDYTVAWLDLVLKFETARKAIHYNDEHTVSMDVSYGFSEAYTEITGKKLNDAMIEVEDKDSKQMVLSKNGKLILNGNLTKHMCTNVMELLFNDLEKLMANNNLRYQGILMTGGFGESLFAREYLCSKQEKKEMNPITLYTPDNSASLLTIGAIASIKQKKELEHTIAVMFTATVKPKDIVKDEVKIFPLMFKGQSIEVGKSFEFGPMQSIPVDPKGDICASVVYIPEYMKMVKNTQYYKPSGYESRIEIGVLRVKVPPKDHRCLHKLNFDIICDYYGLQIIMTLQTSKPKKFVSVYFDYMPEKWVKREKPRKSEVAQQGSQPMGPIVDEFQLEEYDNIEAQREVLPSDKQSYKLALQHN